MVFDEHLVCCPRVLTRRAEDICNSIRNNTRQSEWADWPMLTRDDYVLVGNIVVLYSYMDLNLRRIAEVTDHAGILPPPWSGKVEKLNITDNSTHSRHWIGLRRTEAR